MKEAINWNIRNVQAMEASANRPIELFIPDYEKPKKKGANSFITEEIDLLSKLLQRPFKMVAGLTKDFSIDELRDMRTQAMKSKIDPAKAWWFLRKKRKEKLKQINK